MKWSFSTLLQVALAVLIGLGASGAAFADRLKVIQERGTLIVGVKADYEPFGFRNSDGDLVGYDIDVAKAFADVIGVGLDLRPVTSANRLQKLQTGEIDIVAATLGDTRSRRKLVQMIEPQYYGDGANVLLRQDTGITGWNELRGRTLCSVQGALWNRLAKERLLLDTIALNNTREAALALRNQHCIGWLYDEVNLLNELRSDNWTGYGISLPTRFVLPWAVAIAPEEADGPLDRLLGDTIAEWHRNGFLQDLERRWSLPQSPYLRQARQTWLQTDETGEPVCRRDSNGQWPLACRQVGLVSGEGVGGISGTMLAFMDATGIDLSIAYDPHDRGVFVLGLALTAALSLLTVLGSIVLGPLLGIFMHRRTPILAPLIRSLCLFVRLTPPLLQIYLVFFGLGGVVLALGFTLDAFTVTTFVLALYAGASNATVFSDAADILAGRGPRLTMRWHDVHSAHRLCHSAVMGNCVNIVKATGMASTLALPELVHASTAIIAEKGNTDVMMNVLLLSYFVLIIVAVQAFRYWERHDPA